MLTFYLLAGLITAIYRLLTIYIPCGNLYGAKEKAALFVLDTTLGPMDVISVSAARFYDKIFNWINR
jgi:hypothetical protein